MRALFFVALKHISNEIVKTWVCWNFIKSSEFVHENMSSLAIRLLVENVHSYERMIASIWKNKHASIKVNSPLNRFKLKYWLISFSFSLVLPTLLEFSHCKWLSCRSVWKVDSYMYLSCVLCWHYVTCTLHLVHIFFSIASKSSQSVKRKRSVKEWRLTWESLAFTMYQQPTDIERTINGNYFAL